MGYYMARSFADVGLKLALGFLVGIALVAVLYVMIIPKSKDGKFSNKFFQWLHDFFNFKKLYIESVLRFFYVLGTSILFSIGFFMLFGRTFGAGLALMIFAVIGNRVIYELCMLTIMMVKNVIEINNKINGKNEKLGFASADDMTEKFASGASSFAAKVSEQVSDAVNKDTEKSGEDTKFCPNCGKKITGSSSFCPDCGTKIQ